MTEYHGHVDRPKHGGEVEPACSTFGSTSGTSRRISSASTELANPGNYGLNGGLRHDGVGCVSGVAVTAEHDRIIPACGIASTVADAGKIAACGVARPYAVGPAAAHAGCLSADCICLPCNQTTESGVGETIKSSNHQDVNRAVLRAHREADETHL
jgi:hypothetical protein